MANPILQMMGQQQSNNLQGVVKQARQIMSSANNPIMASVMAMCGGRDPKQVFYDECQRRGINPDDILNSLK